MPHRVPLRYYFHVKVPIGSLQWLWSQPCDSYTGRRNKVRRVPTMILHSGALPRGRDLPMRRKSRTRWLVSAYVQTPAFEVSPPVQLQSITTTRSLELRWWQWNRSLLKQTSATLYDEKRMFTKSCERNEWMHLDSNTAKHKTATS